MSKLQDILDAVSQELINEMENYLDDQPHAINCSVCNSALEFTSELDPDGDLMVNVEPCENCLREAREQERKNESL